MFNPFNMGVGMVLEAVGVSPGGRQCDDHITGCPGLGAQELFLIHNESRMCRK